MGTLEAELGSLEQQGRKRSLKSLTGIDFCSNDYLGFSQSPQIRQKLLQFLKTEPALGSTGSRLISGENQFVQQTEAALAKTFAHESLLFFGSGYLANLGVMGALATTNCEFFSDQLNHASLIDGMALALGKQGGKKQLFRHNDLNHLEELLKKSTAVRKVVVTESVFSMDGDSPDLRSLCQLCETHEAFLVVDEAHATGVHGHDGLGLMHDLTYAKARTVIVHTAGKALGAYGAFVTCNQTMRELLINKSRSLIYSTALPPILLAQIQFAIEEVGKTPQLRQQIADNVNFARECFARENLLWSGTHIGYLLVPGNDKVMAMAEALNAQGIQVKAIRSPTVATGQERLRFTLKAFNAKADIEHLSHCLAKAMQ